MNCMNRIKRLSLILAMVLPVVFVLCFLGYFPVQYEIVLQTDNVVGEGICRTFVCPLTVFSSRYSVGFYFGSELKKANVGKYHYDVGAVQFVVADVSEFDIKSFDSYIKGIHLAHVAPEDVLPAGEIVHGKQTTMESRDGVLHVTVHDPAVGSTIVVSSPFIPWWFWLGYFAVIILVSVLLSIGLEKLFAGPLAKYAGITCFAAFKAVCVIIAFLAGCFFCGSLSYITYENFLLNCAFLISLSLLLDALTLPFMGTLLTMVFTLIWYIANYFVMAFRGKPIMPADLKALGTAAEVAGGYRFVFSWQMLLGIAVTAAYAFVLVRLWLKWRTQKKVSLRRNLGFRGASVIAAAVLYVLCLSTSTFKLADTFAWDAAVIKSFHEEGMVLAFLKTAYNSIVHPPEGYSGDVVDSYLAEYINADESEATVGDEGIRPTNIIMVMNEAFSDLRTAGLSSEIDVMPFVDSLCENTVKGNLYVSIFGGGTCNTEFEALTGNSLAFLGPGVYPYTENVMDPMWSLAEYFKSEGYMAEVFHPNAGSNWNRRTVYPNLGFEAFHDIEDFEAFGEVVELHGLPADITDYRYIESVSDENAGRPRFLFDVTMQNHSGYERWIDVDIADSVSEEGRNLYLDTQVYLSLVKASDDQVRQLVEHYRDIGEPTMIIFFGDHQPCLPDVAMNQIYGNNSQMLNMYKTRFFIWTNYDSPETDSMDISANYLPWLIMKHGNFRMPPYVKMLGETYEQFPIVTAQGIVDVNGNEYLDASSLADNDCFKKYWQVQYANMFDKIDDKWFVKR